PLSHADDKVAWLHADGLVVELQCGAEAPVALLLECAAVFEVAFPVRAPALPSGRMRQNASRLVNSVADAAAQLLDQIRFGIIPHGGRHDHVIAWRLGNSYGCLMRLMLLPQIEILHMDLERRFSGQSYADNRPKPAVAAAELLHRVGRVSAMTAGRDDDHCV